MSGLQIWSILGDQYGEKTERQRQRVIINESKEKHLSHFSRW